VPAGPELDFLAPHGRERLPLPAAASEASVPIPKFA
jgi:hypothetical protein